MQQERHQDPPGRGLVEGHDAVDPEAPRHDLEASRRHELHRHRGEADQSQTGRRDLPGDGRRDIAHHREHERRDAHQGVEHRDDARRQTRRLARVRRCGS